MSVTVTVTVSELGYLTVTRNVLVWISMPIAKYGLARLDRARGDSVGPRYFMARHHVVTWNLGRSEKLPYVEIGCISTYCNKASPYEVEVPRGGLL